MPVCVAPFVAACNSGQNAETFDWYISGTGNDTTGDGSLLAPYATLGKALTVVGANQTIGVLDGTYYERNLSSAVDGITIKQVAGSTAVFRGSDLYAAGAWSKTAGQTNVYQAAITTNCHGVFNGATKLSLVADVATCDGTANSYYFDNPGNLLYVNIGGAAPTAIDALVSAQELLTYTGAGLTVQDGTLEYWEQALDIQDTGAFSLSGLTVRYLAPAFTTYYVIRVDGDGGTVTGCTITTDGVYGNGAAGGAIEVESTAANVTVTGNTLQANTDGQGDGIVAQGGSGHLVTLNTIDGFQNGIRVMGDAGGVASYNTVTDCSHALITHDSTHTGTWTDHHNLCYLTAGWSGPDDGEHGIVMHSNGVINLYHNLVAWLTRSSGPDGQEAFYVDGDATITMRNNAVYQCDLGIYEFGGAPTYDLDYTGFYGVVTNNYSGVDVGDQGANDVTGDPLYTDATNNDFTLQGDSPYRGAGENVAGVSEQNPPTIGRYEYAT